MEPQQKRHSPGIVTVVVSLAAVCVFWAVYFAYRHQAKPPDSPRPLSQKELTDELNAIQAPPGVKRVEIPSPVPDENAKNRAIASYSANSDCNTLAEHYKKEFARHGFVYRPLREDTNKYLKSSAFFCRRGVLASFGCMSQPEYGQSYLIVLRSSDEACAD
jgi:hypothetical protein